MSQQPAKQFKDMGGYIAKNAKKSSPNQPDWRGKVRVNGKELLISGWIKDGQPDLMNVSLTDPDTLPPKPEARTPQVGHASGAPSSSAPQGGKDGEEDIFNDLFGSV